MPPRARLNRARPLSSYPMESPYALPTLTKMDVAALRKGDVLCVHLTSQYPKGLVRVIKRADRNEANPFAQDQEHIIDGTAIEPVQGNRGVERPTIECRTKPGEWPFNTQTSEGLVFAGTSKEWRAYLKSQGRAA
jgi:hypothetical protein